MVHDSPVKEHGFLIMDSISKVQPMPLRMSILFFWIPAVLVYILIYKGMPFLLRRGLSGFWSLVTVITVGGTLLIAASVFFYIKEGNALTWQAFAERFRLKKMSGKDWLWLLGILIFAMAAGKVLSSTVVRLAKIPFFSPPDFLLAVFNPLTESSPKSPEFLGIMLKGKWWIVPVYFLMLCFNVFGEEFWWRGYIMPRQELVHGNFTWIIHGLLWTSFHFCWKWNLMGLLPSCLALSFAVYMTKNTTIGIIAHFIGNGMILIPIIIGIIN